MSRASTMAATGPIKIDDDSRMSEDYVQTADVLIASTSRSPLAAVKTSNKQWTAVAIVADLGLVHVVPDNDSQSGYDLLPLSQGDTAKEVVAGVDGAGTSHAFYHDGAHTWHASLTGHAWSPADPLPFSVGLGTDNVPLSDELVAYGVTPEGNLQLMRRDGTSHRWQAVVCDMGKVLVGAQVVLKMIDHDNWTLAAAITGKLQLFSGRGSTLASGPYTVSTTNPVTRLHFAYQRSGSTLVMFSDTTNALFTSFGFSDQVTAIADLRAVQGMAVIDTAYKIHFYGTDPDGKLWVLHQKGWSPNDAPQWVHAIPLDRDVAQVASPQSAIDGAVLFATGVDQTLHRLSQDPGTQRWTRTKLQRPSGGKPYHLTAYRTQLTVRDANGNPAPGAEVTFAASSETAILVRGTTYLVGPGAEQTATVRTDMTGILTITRTATNLLSPSYTISSPRLGAPQTIYPDKRYHEFLAGSSPINTSSVIIPPMSEETLTSAMVNGQPLSPNLKDKAKVAADGINNAMKSVPQASAELRAAGYTGWALHTDASGAQFIQFRSPEALQAHLAAIRAGLRAGNIWDDIADFYGDVWRGIETTAMAVMKFGVDVVNSVVSLYVEIGEELVELAAMVITSIEDAIPLVHAIFSFIGAEVERVLDWVKDQLGWSDIWNTKQVIEHLVAEAVPALQWAIEQRGIVETGQFFASLKSSVTGEFQKAAEYFGSKSIGQIATLPHAVRPGHGLRPAAFAQASTSSPAQSNWIMSKVIDNVSASALSPLNAPVPPDIADELWGLLNDPSMTRELQLALSDLVDFFTILFTDPNALAARGVADLIKAAQALVSFVFDLADRLLSALLKVLGEAVQVADHILTQSLGDIPVVSWLYTNVVCPRDQPETLTILRLASLVMAVPVTLLHKLDNSMKPPFDAAAVRQILAWKFVPPTSLKQAALAAPLDETSLQRIYFYLSAIQACADMAADGTSLVPEETLWSQCAGWFDVLITAAMQVIAWPPASKDGNAVVFDFDWDWTGFTDGQRLARAAWIAGWVPVLTNLGLLVVPTPKQGMIAEGIDPAGKTFLVALGAMAFGLGLAGSIKSLADEPPTANGFDVAAAVLGPLPNLAQFLRYDSVIASSDGATAIVKVVLDDLCDMAVGVLQRFG